MNGIRNSEAADDIAQRIENLNSYFTYSLYQNVCRSLFERHKLLFSFILTTRILQGQGRIDPAEWRFLISGQSGKVRQTVKAPPSTLSHTRCVVMCAARGHAEPIAGLGH